jgi:hypothetical protein
MFSVYSGKFLSHKAVHNWVENFSKGHSEVADDAQPGRPVVIATEATVQRVEELIQADSRIMIRQCSNYSRAVPWFGIQHDA